VGSHYFAMESMDTDQNHEQILVVGFTTLYSIHQLLRIDAPFCGTFGRF
jgi:hypothetical protein